MNNNIFYKLFLSFVMMLFTMGVSAQGKITVTGTVVDGTGETIIGASIIEIGTTNGVISDFDGNFKIDVKNEKAQLRISYVGFNTQTILVGAQHNIKVVLKEDNQVLKEVVVVGYGAQKRRV